MINNNNTAIAKYGILSQHGLLRNGVIAPFIM